MWTFHVTQSYKNGYNRRQHRHSLGKPTLHHSWQPWKKIGWYDEKWVSWTEVWKNKTKRWFVYYNPTSTSNLIKIRLVEAILNKATQDLATSYRGHLRLTYHLQMKSLLSKSWQAALIWVSFPQKNLYVQSVVNKVLETACVHTTFWICCLFKS